MVMKRKISLLAYILVISTVTALMLAETAIGRYQDKNEDLTVAKSMALIIFFVIGFVFNYYGWKLQHIFVSLIGFIIGFVIFGAIGGIIFSALIGLAFFFVFRKLATKKAMMLISAFLVGAFVQPLLILTIMFPPWRPASDADFGFMNFIWLVSFFIGIVYVWISRKFYKFFIILILSVLGTIMISYALQEFIPIAGFIFPLFITLLFSGILTQYKKESKETQIGGEVPKVKRKSIKILGGIALTAIGLFFFAFSVAAYLHANNTAYWTLYPNSYLQASALDRMWTGIGWGIFFIFAGSFALYSTRLRYNKLDFLAGIVFFVASLLYNNIDSFFPSISPIPAMNDKITGSVLIYQFFNTHFPSSPKIAFENLSLSIILFSICILVISYYIKHKKSRSNQPIEKPSIEEKQTKTIHEIGDRNIQAQKIEAAAVWHD